MQAGILHDRSWGQGGGGDRLTLDQCPSGSLEWRAGRGRARDADRVLPADQAGRAILVCARSADVNGILVVTNASIRVLIQPVHRPLGRDANLEAVIGDGLLAYLVAGLAAGLPGAAGERFAAWRGGDAKAGARYGGSRVGGKADAEDPGLLPEPRSDCPECQSAHDDGHYGATHKIPPE
jgi:hypothetical protein